MAEKTVLIDKHDSGYGVVTLNRPAAMNALSRRMRPELAEAIDALGQDEAIRVLILTGAGRAFCAGLDLKELGAAGAPALGMPDAHNPNAAMARFRGPIIGAINGAAVTGGFELALRCDILVCSTAARFADSHVRVGVMPGWGLSQRLSRIIGPYRAKELSLTGNFLSAEQAADWGLVNRVVAPDQLMPQSRQLAADMLSAVPEMLLAVKRVIDDGYALSFGDGLALEGERARATHGTVKAGDVEKRRVAILARARSVEKS